MAVFKSSSHCFSFLSLSFLSISRSRLYTRYSGMNVNLLKSTLGPAPSTNPTVSSGGWSTFNDLWTFNIFFVKWKIISTIANKKINGFPLLIYDFCELIYKSNFSVIDKRFYKLRLVMGKSNLNWKRKISWNWKGISMLYLTSLFFVKNLRLFMVFHLRICLKIRYFI